MIKSLWMGMPTGFCLIGIFGDMLRCICINPFFVIFSGVFFLKSLTPSIYERESACYSCGLLKEGHF